MASNEPIEPRDPTVSQTPRGAAQSGFAEHNVLAVFSGMDEARKAIDALGRAGIDGGVAGGISSFDMTEAWELTHESVKADRVVVGVHSDDPTEVERAADVLAKRDPIRVDRFGVDGRLLRG